MAGGNEFVMVDADTQQKQPAFDHEKLAAALSRETRNNYTGTHAAIHHVQLRGQPASHSDGDRCRSVALHAGRLRVPAHRRSPCRRWTGRTGRRLSAAPQAQEARRLSPDGKWEALIQNYNVAIRAVGSQSLTMLSFDGSEGNYYDLRSIQWSPDSRKLAAYRVTPGYRREVHYVAVVAGRPAAAKALARSCTPSRAMCSTSSNR